MTLHIFNPEHDLALAGNQPNFTAPHAARALRSGLGFLPALWAKKGDVILVDEKNSAQKAFMRLQATTRWLNISSHATPAFVVSDELKDLNVTSIDTWGWNHALKSHLICCGIDAAIMPDDNILDGIRDLSHRKHAASLLHYIQTCNTVGEAYACADEGDIRKQVRRLGRIVLKAPWSSSGRGIRFVDGCLDDNIHGWIKNMLNRQGCLMLEPYYKKVKDFGMEFYSDGHGGINYLGLSLFHTENNSYSGNILATEHVKTTRLMRYLPKTLLEDVRQTISHRLGILFNNIYKGPFGIDMMIIPNDGGGGFMLHPCVEINLRRTMGHVALALSPKDDDMVGTMQIMTCNNYQLKIQSL